MLVIKTIYIQAVAAHEMNQCTCRIPFLDLLWPLLSKGCTELLTERVPLVLKLSTALSLP